MRRLVTLAASFLTFLSLAWAASVGSGAATTAIQSSFINAYNRGLFSLFVNTPTTDVRALGSPGLVQEFPSRQNSNAKYALVKPDPDAPLAQFDTLQVYSDIYTYYTTVGVAAAGYPTMDTTACPGNDFGVCNYQLFTKNYALFAYSSPLTANFAVRDPFYTVWLNRGGIGGILGGATSNETSVTSFSKVAGTQQTFLGGHIYSFPAGSATPSSFSLSGPFYSAWTANGGFGVLGFPTSDEIVSVNGGPKRQTFEGGRIEQAPGEDPVVLFPVAQVDITFASQGVSLAPGVTATISATTLDTRGSSVLGRTLTWSSTNGAVARVTGNAYTATIQAIAARTVNIFATSEGKTSAPISVRVGGACCVVGEGAPTQAIAQAFQLALDRNQLTASLPVAAPIARTGSGYVQAISAGGTAYLISLADGAAAAYVSSGAIAAAYVASGGFTGPLGYPAGDPLPGGLQRYSSGAVLAGNPVRILQPAVAAKWLQSGSLTGTLGSPVADAEQVSSLLGTPVTVQKFTSGAIYSISASRTYLSYGLVYARYVALAGPTGLLGAPTGDLANSRQDFETGYIDIQPGALAAVEHFSPRKPAMSVTPATVVPGGRVHVNLTGFAPGASLNFTVTGQPNFSARVAAGVFEWDINIPASAKPGTVFIQAGEPGGTDAASASYTISDPATLSPRLTVLTGDQQTGTPGSLLPVPVTISLVDSGGAPIAGVPVSWTLSPGASVTGSATTDSNGRASVSLRLPLSAGVAVGAVNAAGRVATFSSLVQSKTITGFPTFQQQSDSGGALVAALAALIRYQQSSFAAAPRGLATVALVHQYLMANGGYSAVDNGSPSAARIANPWVAAQFADVALVVEKSSLNTIRDLISAGTPVVALLSLRRSGQNSGSTAVNVIGANADGTLAITDPDAGFARATLQDYLTGFATAGGDVQATLTGVVRVVATPYPSQAFTVASPIAANAELASNLATCAALDIPAQNTAGGLRFHYCDGRSSSYELDLAADYGATVRDLAAGLNIPVAQNAALAWTVSRKDGTLGAVQQTLSLSAVRDAASFNASLAPGSIISIFGNGLSAGGKAPAVTLEGRTLQVLASTPFQVNAVIPPDSAAGSLTLVVKGALGTASLSLALTAVAPQIFLIGGSQGAVINQDGSINGALNPAQRGQAISIYCTGLGATTPRNGLPVTVAPVTVSVNGGQSLTATFAGAVNGYPGLYQINVQLPAATAPGAAVPLSITQTGRTSNITTIAVQ